MKKLLFIYSIFFLSINTFGQEIYFSENFENSGNLPDEWSTDYVQQTWPWEFIDGGGNPNAADPDYRIPDTTYQGEYNALFYIPGAENTYKTKLITPLFSLAESTKPQLEFFYAQEFNELPSGENTQLHIYYRLPDSTNTWILLKEYDDETNGWQKAIIQIHDTIHAEKVQLAFEGIASNKGFGTCVDSVAIFETDIIPKYIESITCTQASQENILTNSNNNPILKLTINVKGNNGSIILDSLAGTALLNSANVVPSNGVKIFYTNYDAFNESNQLGSGSSIISGKAIFTNINKDIPFGYSYIWVTYDIPEDTNHDFKYFKVDASLDANSIKIANNLYPENSLNPSGYRELTEAIFFDNFEEDKGWVLLGEFEIDSARGLGAENWYNPDPDIAYSGYNILGTDITGLNSRLGDIEDGIGSKAYKAILLEQYLKYYKNINIQYQRWININSKDSITLEYSLKSGWNYIWKTPQSITDDAWHFVKHSLASELDRQDTVNIRFTAGPTAGIRPASGLNVDNFALTGTFVEYDAGIIAINYPSGGCGFTNEEYANVTVKNFGYENLSGGIPVAFSIDNGITWVRDILNTTLKSDSVIEFNFTVPIDMSLPGEYKLKAKTELVNEDDSRNDLFAKTIYVYPNYSLPYVENFEADNGNWKTGGSETWEYGIPAGSVLDTAASGLRAWATKLNANYPDNDSSWIESPCLNFTDIIKPIFEVKISSKVEKQKDGLTLLYSIDEGLTWEHVPNDSYNWNWYSGTIDALGVEGWDSVAPSGFIMARKTLPAEVSGINPVKFRLVFASDAQNNDEGFVIDDVRVYEAPVDAGVTAISYPDDSTCYLGTTEQLKVYIENYGIRAFKPSDNLITYIDLDGTTVLKDTFNVSSNVVIGDSVEFTFTPTINMRDSGTYNFTAYTMVVGDSNMYNNESSDTLTTSLWVTGEPDYSLGPDIGTNTPNSITISAGAGYDPIQWYKDGEILSGEISPDLVLGDGSYGEGEYSMIATNPNGCEVKDTVIVIGSTVDLSATEFTNLGDDRCQGAEDSIVKVTITNIGTAFNTNDTIYAGYQINNEDEVIELIKLPDGLASGLDTIYTFMNQPDFSTPGEKILKCFSSYQPELNYSNDTVDADTVVIHPAPVVDLGQDTIYSDMKTPITLDAGASPYEYIWMDDVGFNDTTYVVNQKTSGKYFVNLTDTSASDCGVASDTVWIITDNWKVDSILSIQTKCTGTSSDSITLRVINKSENTYSDGYQINASYTFNSTKHDEQFTLAEELGAKDSIVLTFTDKVDLSNYGKYTIQGNINPTFDADTNDNKTIKNFDIWGTFPVDLGYDTIFTKRADSITLDAGDYYSEYLWSNASTNQFYNIPNNNSGMHVVQVNDEHGCSDFSDTVYIFAYDIGIDQLISPLSQCELKNQSEIEFKLQNTGNDPIDIGEIISYFYKIDSNEWIEIKDTLTTAIEPDESFTKTIKQSLTFVSGEAYNFQLYARWTKDNYYDNDSIAKTIYEYDKPSFELGSDIYTSQADTIILESKEGYANYQWQDFSNNWNYEISNNSSNTYICKAVNSYGCYNYDTIQIFTYDLGIESINSLNNCSISANNEVTANIKVTSYDTLLIGQILTAKYSFDTINVSETVTLTASLFNSKPYPYTFTTPFAVSDTGNYSITCSVEMANEVDSSNNSADTTFRIGAYSFDLGSDIISNLNSETLDAGSGYAAYLWNDSSTNQTLAVTASGQYKVTTTNANGCEASDSINVLFLVPAYNVTQILGLSDACEHSSSETVSFILQNTGNDTLQAATEINIAFKINAFDAHEEDYTFASNFTPGAIDTITFTNGADLSATGVDTLLVTATVNDKTTRNDTIINTWAKPLINLGDDMDITADSVILDAREGLASYLWSTSDETQTIEVRANGDYSVSVTNSNGCTNSDTIKVYFVPASLYISEFISPLSGCGTLNDALVKMVVTNGGSKVIRAGTLLVVGYQVEGETRVTQNPQLSNDFKPENNYHYEFPDLLNLTNSGNVNLSLYVGINGADMDTLTTEIPIYEKPIFFDGNDTITVELFPYQLDSKVAAESYLWNTNATTKAITINNTGDYWVQITDNNECLFTDSIYVHRITGVHDAWSNQIKVYPNPGEKEIWIDLPDNIGTITLQITDLNGKVILTNKDVNDDLSLEISDWKQGIYMLRIFNENAFGVYQIIKR